MSPSLPESATGPSSLKANSIQLLGLDNNVQIFRDKTGIAHVKATSTRDAFFAQGFVHAQDRLFAMDWDRMRAAGRASEYVGESALMDDVLYRRLDLITSAKRDFEILSADAKEMLTSYAAGVNAFIALGELPCEFALLRLTSVAPWTPIDPIAIWKVRHVLMGNAGAKLARARLVAALGVELTAKLVTSVGFNNSSELIIPEAREAGEQYSYGLGVLESLKDGWEVGLREVMEKGVAGGSNCFVVGGEKTQSGNPMLGGDPHRGLDSPTVYYPNHIQCPAFDLIGFSFHGIPGVQHFGHTEKVGWCITHAMTDYQDLYLEKVVPGPTPGPHYLSHTGLPTPFTTTTSTILALANPPTNPPSYTSHPVTSYATTNGPVVLGDPSRDRYVVSLKYTALQPNKQFECHVKGLFAKTADEFEEAMREWVDSCNNMCYLDLDGNFGYRTRGKVPIRHSLNGWLPVPGWLPDYQWKGEIPFEEMPHSRNPASGRVVTCNNPIEGTGGRYNHYLSNDYYPPSRAVRVHQIMDSVEKSSRKFTPADFSTIHDDRVSVRAPVFQSLLSSLPQSSLAALSGDARTLRDAVVSWNGVTDKESSGAAAYEAFREALYSSVMEDPKGPFVKAGAGLRGEGDYNVELGDPAHLFRPLYTYFYRVVDYWIEKNDVTALAPGITWESVAIDALPKAVELGKKVFGGEISKWRW
ncbi:hypothetical protein HDU93_002372 [Gonapodya sp. JEL0774]|nr:hypothetical protein HDU93_002372 [Gonapodya sp. JEL0774]